MLQGLTAGLKQPLGQPVKGQAALLKADIDPALPTIFFDGLYVVAHEGGHAAIGSTSENRFEDPTSTDVQLDVLIEAARGIVPTLRDAPLSSVGRGFARRRSTEINDRPPSRSPAPDRADRRLQGQLRARPQAGGGDDMYRRRYRLRIFAAGKLRYFKPHRGGFTLNVNSAPLRFVILSCKSPICLRIDGAGSGRRSFP